MSSPNLPQHLVSDMPGPESASASLPLRSPSSPHLRGFVPVVSSTMPIPVATFDILTNAIYDLQCQMDDLDTRQTTVETWTSLLATPQLTARVCLHSGQQSGTACALSISNSIVRLNQSGAATAAPCQPGNPMPIASGVPWVLKPTFSTFDGVKDPLVWLNRCERFLQAQHTRDGDRIWLALFHMTGIAQQWCLALDQDVDDVARTPTTLVSALICAWR